MKVAIIGHCSAYLGDAQSFLQPLHADVTVFNPDHFNLVTILDRSHPLSGRHVID